MAGVSWRRTILVTAHKQGCERKATETKSHKVCCPEIDFQFDPLCGLRCLAESRIPSPMLTVAGKPDRAPRLIILQLVLGEIAACQMRDRNKPIIDIVDALDRDAGIDQYPLTSPQLANVWLPAGMLLGDERTNVTLNTTETTTCQHVRCMIGCNHTDPRPTIMRATMRPGKPAPPSRAGGNEVAKRMTTPIVAILKEAVSRLAESSDHGSVYLVTLCRER